MRSRASSPPNGTQPRHIAKISRLARLGPWFLPTAVMFTAGEMSARLDGLAVPSERTGEEICHRRVAKLSAFRIAHRRRRRVETERRRVMVVFTHMVGLAREKWPISVCRGTFF